MDYKIKRKGDWRNMTFAIEPVRKVEIKPRGEASFIDVSSYVIRDSTLDLSVGTKISGGDFIFDKNILEVIPNIGRIDEIKVSVGDGPLEGAVALYNLNGDSKDEIGSNDGTDTGITYVTGKIGQAAETNLSTDKIVFDSVIDLTGDQTICAWVKTTDSSGYIFANRDVSNGYASVFINSGKVVLIIKNHQPSASIGTINDGEWHHVAVTYKVSNGEINYYIDGDFDRTVTDTTTMTAPSGTQLFERVGGNGNLTHLIGSLDDVRIYNKVLSASEINQIYNSGTGGENKHIYTGLLRDSSDTNNDDTIGFEHRSYAILAVDRAATEVYREDAATGDPVDAFKDIIDKYLTELNYDATSIPATPAGTEDFKNYRLQNVSIKEVFDFIADYLNRIWYVDEDKKVWLIEKTFTATGYTLETGTDGNIIGALVDAVDLTKWANYVAIDGKVFEVGTEETFEANVAQTEFDLATRPFQTTVKVDDAIQTGSITGTDFSDEADYIVDTDAPSITFATPMTGGESVVVEYKVHSKIHEEQADQGSRETFGTRAIKIVNDNIDTVEKAIDIGQNYLAINSVPLHIYSGRTFWNTNVMPLKSLTLRDNVSPRSINVDVNVIEVNLRFGDKSFELGFKLNDFDFTSLDLYENLINRVKRIEFNLRDSGQQIAKYLFFGANFAISVNNLDITSEGIGNSFTLDHEDTALDDASVYLDGVDGGGSLTDEGTIRSVSLDNQFEEEFISDHYEGDIQAGAPDWDTTSNEWSFVNADIGRTKIIEKSGLTYSKATLIIEGTDLGNLQLRLRADDDEAFEDVTNSTLHTFTNTSTDGIMVEVEASGNATITNMKLTRVI